MKLFALLFIISLSSFADVGIECTNIPFGDISKIEINIYHGDVFIKEYDRAGNSSLVVTSENMEGLYESEISEWNGYTRVLSHEDGKVFLTVSDECTSNTQILNCKIK